MSLKEQTERLVNRLAENLFEAAFALEIIIAINMEERDEAAREEPSEDALVAENALAQTIDALQELHERQNGREGLDARELRRKQATKAIWLPQMAAIMQIALKSLVYRKREPGVLGWRYTMLDVHHADRSNEAKALELPEATMNSLFHLAFVTCAAGSAFRKPRVVEIQGNVYEIRREDRALPTLLIRPHLKA